MLGSCRLCGEIRGLQESHVIPSFVYKWMKETSATGFMRFGENPNKRVQDGHKEYWLCASCEKRLNVWETVFASRAFHPLNNDGGQFVRYGAWMMKFCASISWRTLLKFRQDGLNDLSWSQLSAVDRALNVWSEVILEKRNHPSEHQQHIVLLDTIAEASDRWPANINRYILRTVAMDVIRSEATTFVFTKMGKVLVLGFIDVRYSRQWVGTKIHAREGLIGLGNITVPIQFRDYLIDKANRYAQISSSISDVQQSKIAKAARQNLDRVARSGTFAAMRDDVERSGKAAFNAHKPKASR